MATAWSVAEERYDGWMMGRSFVMEDLMVTVPREVGAMRAASMVAYW